MPDEATHNGRDFTTLHYELAADVKALRERLRDAENRHTELATEIRTPKPAQWGVFATVGAVVISIFLSIGGLIHTNLIQRIDTNRIDFETSDKLLSERITEIDHRHNHIEDSMEEKSDASEIKRILFELSSHVVTRAEHDARNAALPAYLTKAEADAMLAGYNVRLARNEGYIEEARKAEPVHSRINQLYELYRQLERQQVDLHSRLGQRTEQICRPPTAASFEYYGRYQ